MSEQRTPYPGLCSGYASASMRCTEQVTVQLASVPLCDTHRLAVIHAATTTSEDVPFVYYIGDPATQLVKIGFTTLLKKRVAMHRNARPAALLLATEPGGRSVERARHRQFRHLRRPQGPETEWFQRCPELMEHVSQVRVSHGISAALLRVPQEWIAPVRVA